MPVEAGKHLEVRIAALANGEDCDNHMNFYCSAATAPVALATWLAAFRTLFRAQVLPLVCDIYSVVQYQARILEGVIWKSTADPRENPPVWPRVSPLLRWEEQEFLAGVAVDDAGVVETAEMPSLVAVGVGKACGKTTKPDLTPVTYSRFMRGANRFSGIPEASTDDATGNTLNAAAVTAWQAAMNALRIPTISGCSMHHEVWSLYANNAPRIEAGTAAWARAPVTQMIIDTDVTSQVTRKPRRGQ